MVPKTRASFGVTLYARPCRPPRKRWSQGLIRTLLLTYHVCPFPSVGWTLPCGQQGCENLRSRRCIRTCWLCGQDSRSLPIATTPAPPTPSLPYSRGVLAVVFYNFLHYYFITFQVTGSRIDFVSILAGRTWSALMIV